jgi:hypothetical protein
MHQKQHQRRGDKANPPALGRGWGIYLRRRKWLSGAAQSLARGNSTTGTSPDVPHALGTPGRPRTGPGVYFAIFFCETCPFFKEKEFREIWGSFPEISVSRNFHENYQNSDIGGGHSNLKFSIEKPPT